MTQDMIAYWAGQRPEAIAVAGIGGVVSYRAFDEAINKVAARLRTLDPPASGLVAVRTRNLYGLYLLERALDRMGLTSVILPPATPPDGLLTLLAPDLYLTNAAADDATVGNTVPISPGWMARILDGPPAPPPDHQRRPGDVARVVVSSGTTGQPKAVSITREMLERRRQTSIIVNDLSRASRVLLGVGPQTIGGLEIPDACWMLGGSVAIFDPRKTYEEILRLRPSYICMSPRQLEALLREIPRDAAPLAGLHVDASGSLMPPALAGEVMRRLSGDLWISYGSTELDNVASGHASLLGRHERAVGHVTPGMAVEIVDGEGAPLPAGRAGMVRTRGPGLFSGYRGDEAATAAALRDGWFYPGDLGALTAEGLLVIEGRIAELMNLGGVKIDPAAVDAVARTCPGVTDAAAFAAPDDMGVQRPWIAVVRAPAFETDRLVTLLRGRWPALHGLTVAAVAAIPRNGMQKVERRTLTRMALDARRR
jgi:acyl-CoA synthetase (AMP-forming)/AMP-acid ligase II